MKVKLRIKPEVGLYVRLRGTRAGAFGNVRQIVEICPTRTFLKRDIIGRKYEWIRINSRTRSEYFLSTGKHLPAGVWRPSPIATYTTNDISKVSDIWSNGRWVKVFYDWTRESFVVK